MTAGRGSKCGGFLRSNNAGILSEPGGTIPKQVGVASAGVAKHSFPEPHIPGARIFGLTGSEWDLGEAID